MNEFNPFETLGIDPNESLPSRTPLETETQVNPMETMGQFNPFKELNINVNGFEQPTADGKNTEVQSMLGIKDFEPMTDEEKQSYVDALSDEDWNTWNNLKSEGYSFEARKALMENQDMLYDITEPGTGKYLQTKSKEPITSTGAQRYLDWYQQRAYGMGDRFEDWMDSWINYKKNGEERTGTGSGVLRAIGNTASSILGYGAQFIEDMLGLQAHAVELNNNLRYIQGKTDQRAELDRSDESYESFEKSITSMVKDLTGLGVSIERAIPSAIFQALGSGDGPVAKVINFTGEVWNDLMAIVPNLTVNTVHNTLMTNPKVREYLEDPANQGMKEDLVEILTNVEMGIFGKWLKNKKSKVGESKASMIYNDVKSKVARDLGTFSQRVKSGIKTANEAADRMKEYNVNEGIEGTSIGRSNVRKATIEGFKKGRKEGFEEKPIETEGLSDTRITPYEERSGLSTEVKNEVKPTPTRTNTDLAKIAEDTKLSENNINNLKSNPDLQTEFKNTIKPYLEANGKNNPEGVITEPVNSLVYDIRSGIDELRTQQANLNRSINNQKLSPMEKALIKEIEKIIDQKEPKQILKSLGKLTPAQQGLMKRIVPNLDSRIQTINQTLELTMDITKRGVVSKVLKFLSERRRASLSGVIKKQIYKYVSDYLDKQGIKYTTDQLEEYVKNLENNLPDEIPYSSIDVTDWINYQMNTKYPFLSDKGKKVGSQRRDMNKIDRYDKRELDKLKDEGYSPETRLYGDDGPTRPPLLKVLWELDLKPKNGGKTLREIMLDAGVHLTLPTYEKFYSEIAKGQNFDGFFNDLYNLIVMPEDNRVIGTLIHEFGHRLEDSFRGSGYWDYIQDYIEKKYFDLNGRQLEIDSKEGKKYLQERFAEFIRNYFLYGNIEGRVSNSEVGKQMGLFRKDLRKTDVGQNIFNVMDKTRNDILRELGGTSTSDVTELVDSVFKGTERGEEILKGFKEQEFHELYRDSYMKENNLTEIDLKNDNIYSKYGIEKLDLSEFKRVAGSEIKNIHVNEDGVLVGSYHGHKDVPIGLDLDLEEVNIPDNLRQILQKQADEYLEKQNEDVINKIEELNKQDLLVK